MNIRKGFFVVSLIAVFAAAVGSGFFSSVAQAATLQSKIDANTATVNQLNAEIAKYEAAIQQAGADKKTLQSAIDALNLRKRTVEAKISVTQHQINTTQLQIQQLGGSIAATKNTIATNQAALAEDMRAIQENDDKPLIIQLFSSNNLGTVWTDVDNVIQVQKGIQNQVQNLQAQAKQLALSQNATKQKQTTLTSQKQSLASQQQSLSTTVKTKSQLLAETKAKESNFQKLLAKAKAELASFSTFSTNAGGTGLLTHQTSCDSWGCYYNQRDAAWGNDPLNGTKYRLKSDGCLVTSMAMVLTHYGYRNVTPVTINANPANFAIYYPAYLLYTINVDGISATRKSARIDATLATGNPVIVGVYAYGGTHYVVLTSGSHGHYLMRDPYIKNGKDISFSAHYKLRNVFGVARVIISG